MKNNQLYKFLNNYKFIIIICFCLVSFVSYSDINNERFKLYGVRDDYCENKGLRKHMVLQCVFLKINLIYIKIVDALILLPVL